MVKHLFATTTAQVRTPDNGMWQGSGHPSKVNGIPQVLRFPPPCKTTLFDPRYEKTGFLHMRKQRRRSASR